MVTPRPPARAKVVSMTRRRPIAAIAAIFAILLAGTVAVAEVIPAGKAAPELAAGGWINSEPLTMQKLRGRVVLIDFWTYG